VRNIIPVDCFSTSDPES